MGIRCTVIQLLLSIAFLQLISFADLQNEIFTSNIFLTQEVSHSHSGEKYSISYDIDSKGVNVIKSYLLVFYVKNIVCL